jgi:lipooligosaccharide transport system permease protein
MTLALPAARVFQRNWLVYRRLWHRSIAFGFLVPILFLTSMGLGLGGLMTAADASAFGGIDYLAFVGTGLLAGSGMQTATFESTYPIMNKIMWGKNYEAMLSTPLGVRHLVIGELAWVAFRLATIGVVFLVALLLFGVVETPLAALAVPIVVLSGIGFSAWLIAFTATQKNDVGFSAIFRFVVNPLFLFSGTFFPLTQLPDQIEWIAWLTPLFHAVELIRGVVLDQINAGADLAHLAYLVVFFAIGAVLADRSLLRRMWS